MARRMVAKMVARTSSRSTPTSVNPCQIKAGERIRTADVQLGKRNLWLRKYCISKVLWFSGFVGDQLGAGRLAGCVH